MKLRNKINLYTAVLFSVLLLLMNLSIYFLFSNLILESETKGVKEETEKIAEVFNQSTKMAEEGEFLRAYVPIDGMIRIIKPNRQGTLTTTSPTEIELSKEDAIYYTGEISKRMMINHRTYAFASMPIILSDGNVANLQIMKNIERAIENLKILRIVLITVTLIALIPVFISSRLLSDLLIKPVTSMIKTMTEIKQSGQFKRLPLEGKSKDELHEMGETFNHMIDLLETNFEKQKQFVSNASHELKTPLTVIESYASLLKRRGMQEPELFAESIDAIHSEAIRMRDMTEQLLLLAKHNEQWNLHMSEVNLNEFLKQTLHAFQNAYNRKIIFNNELQPSLMVDTDEQKLKQLMYIFLDNARKYSDKAITVAARIKDGQVFIQMIDQGIGIHKDELPKVFDRFYRVDKARNRKSGGSGLGLSLAKELGEVLDIKIDLESKEGIGTTVTLYLQF
ncbi:sensor histidine kinase [Cytobacillus solani]|uniref:histidine kinase n=1 Tax=Cytobacillus solani TaxID=1637975 RepID=A0A0Q3QLK1_9BACI|nr:HAMP domain-containing sensor histidine kinase [Cytobacillus solani]KQL18512.1 histidine kinase [Cytobacillus solani]